VKGLCGRPAGDAIPRTDGRHAAGSGGVVDLDRQYGGAGGASRRRRLAQGAVHAVGGTDATA
jgi:hypothetical protein